MSKKCKDPSDIIIGKKVYSEPCDCACESFDDTPMGPMCKNCGHVVRNLK